MKVPALIVVSLLLVACSGAGSTASPGADAPATLAIETTAPPTGSASPDVTWGPLAVRPPEDGSDTGRAEGTLRITGGCAYLDAVGQPILLTWPADRTTWNSASHAITFVNVDGTVVTIGDGQHVVLGGGDSEAESGISGEDWVSGRDWVAPPASSCSLDSRWAVGAAESASQAP